VTFAALLTLGATSVVHYFYENPRMSWLDALYFASETITTVGFGESPSANNRLSFDFSLSG